MTREEFLQTEEYWTVEIQQNLFVLLEHFMEQKKMNRSQLAQHLGVSKGYISQVLAGDFDHKLSKLVNLALAVGKAPIVTFRDIKDIIAEDAASPNGFEANKQTKPIDYKVSFGSEHRVSIAKMSQIKNIIHSADEPVMHFAEQASLPAQTLVLS